MNSKKKDSLDEFLIFHSLVDPEDVQTEREALEKQGVNFGKMEIAIKEMLSPKKESAPSWLAAAQKKKAAMDSLYNSSKDKLRGKVASAKDVVAEIKAGRHGGLAQRQVMAHFRNRDASSMSEKDIETLLADCDLLHLLNGTKKDE